MYLRNKYFNKIKSSLLKAENFHFTITSCVMYTEVAFPWDVKGPEHGATSNSASAEIKELWYSASIPSYLFMAKCLLR
jgi:hypothetical protein